MCSPGPPNDSDTCSAVSLMSSTPNWLLTDHIFPAPTVLPFDKSVLLTRHQENMCVFSFASINSPVFNPGFVK